MPKGIVSSGFPRVEAVCRSIGVVFDPWQRDLNRCLLAKSADGLYAADTAALSIPRQVGKTFNVGAVCFALCIIVPGLTVVWTAHRFKVARESFNEMRGLAKSPKLAPHLEYDDITTAAGNEMIPFRNGSRIVFAARERGAVRGFTKVGVLVLDEAQILTEAALSDLAPTMNQAENPLVVFMGTPPKPTDPSEVFTGLREDALAGTSEGVFFVEMSADEGADRDDREQWRKANASFPNRTPERSILRLRKLLSDDDFDREALGIWSSVKTKAALDVGQWAALAADPPELRGPSFGVDLDEAGTAYFAVAWHRPDGLVHVQLAGRSTASRLQDRADELTSKHGGQLFAGGPAAKLLDGCEPVSSAEFAAGCRRFADLFDVGELRHSDEPDLNDSVGQAKWRSTGADGAMAWQLKDVPGIGPLAAVTRALHGLMSEAPPAIW